MSDGWYYTRDGRTFGPYPLAQLQQLAAAGHVRLTDLLWTDGMKEWKSASAIKDLFHSPRVRGYSSPRAGRSSRRPSSARGFLIGTVFGLVAGIALSVFAPRMYTRYQESRDAEEANTELVAEQGQGDKNAQPDDKPSETMRLTSGSKRGGH